jgi:GT2 family glycosyltransferase
MTAAPDLSVVISSVGRERPEETIESIVAAASRVEAEVEVILGWENTAPPPPLPPGTRVVEMFPAPLSSARNRGLGLARAPLVAFVDDDEVVDPGWVAGLLAAFRSDSAPDAVFGPVAPRDERGLAYCHFDGGEFRVFRDPATPPWLVGTGGNMAYAKDVLIEAGAFDPFLGAGSVGLSAEESDMIVRLLRAGRTLAWSPEMVVYHPSKTVQERLDSRFPYAYGTGKLVRRHRDLVLGARYSRDVVFALARAARARDRRRWREAKQTLRGFVTGVAFRARPRLPEKVLERLPASLRGQLAGFPIAPQEPRFRPAPHYLYRVGDDLLLHAYADPSDRLGAAFEERDAIRAETGLTGIPQLHAVVPGTDVLWVLEEGLVGVHPDTDHPRTWFDPVAEWGVAVAGAPGRPLRETDWWRDNRAGLDLACPTQLREQLGRALELVGALPARHLHGDFQPKNILLAGPAGSAARVGVIDWEHSYREGFPGLDLLFLAVMARGDRPDPSVVARLAAGAEPAVGPLRDRLARVGLDHDSVRPALLVALVAWAADEGERLDAPGFLARGEPLFGELLHRCADYLS